MITNTGKNIIAKYLIGDAPAYASYIALGCGPKPRPNVSTISGVSASTITGGTFNKGTSTTIPGTSPAQATTISTITNLASTVGLYIGMTLTQTAGTASAPSNTVITAINNLKTITVSSVTLESALPITGTISFKTFGAATVLGTTSTDALWVGAKVSITGGTGSLSSSVDTIVSQIISETSFVISPGNIVALSGASFLLEVDPSKKALDFEMFRVPISSRGYVNDNGTNKIVLTAQLPTEERYEISEIGIYSAGSNTSAGQYDSRTVSAFSGEENWKLSYDNFLYGPSTTSTIFPEIQTSLINGLNVITTTATAIKTNTANGIFSNTTRAARYERPRYLNNVFLLKSDAAFILGNTEFNPTELITAGIPKSLQVTGTNVDLTKNSSSDLMKLAFSLVSIDGSSTDVPDFVRVIVEFSNADGSQYVQMQVNAEDSILRFTDNRYVVSTKRLDELFYSNGGQFSWNSVNTIKAYSCAVDRLLVTNKQAASGKATLTTASAHGLKIDDYAAVFGVDALLNGVVKITDVPTPTTFKYVSTATVSTQTVTPNGTVEVQNPNFYVGIDALRVDNVSTINPLYGLVGYSVIQDSEQQTITKSPNTNNYIEYRFILDVT